MNRAPVPARAAALLVTVLLIAGCGTALPSGDASQPPSASGEPAASEGAPSLQPPATFGPPPSPTPPDDSVPLAIDPTLLDILPEAIDGIPVTEDANEAAIALGNRSLDDLASALDAAVAVDTGTGNLVYALVVRLKPGAFNDELYRQWRDSYDEGACASSGGVVGRAQAEIGGRDTYVTSCVADIRSYHVLLEDQDILVSAWSLGEGRFGEKLLQGLRVPE